MKGLPQKNSKPDKSFYFFEPIKIWKALSCYEFWFYAIIGYWLSLRTGMAVMFHKTGV